MKFTQKNNLTVDGVRLGLTHRDSIMLRKDTDYKLKVQTFTFEDEESEPEYREYFCAVEKSRLDYHKHLDIWICPECFQQYDTKIQDKPVKNKSDFKLHGHHNPYQQFDEDDPNIVFVEGINPDQDQQDQQEGIVEVIRSSEDKRVQHVHVRGNLADALSAINRYEERQKQQRRQQRND